MSHWTFHFDILLALPLWRKHYRTQALPYITKYMFGSNLIRTRMSWIRVQICSLPILQKWLCVHPTGMNNQGSSLNQIVLWIYEAKSFTLTMLKKISNFKYKFRKLPWKGITVNSCIFLYTILACYCISGQKKMYFYYIGMNL